MKSTKGLYIAGGVLGVLCIGTTVISVRKRNRDRLAKAVLAAVNKQLHPVTQGLDAEDALSVHYKDRVMQGVTSKVIVLKETVATRLAKEIHQFFKPWYKGGDDEEGVYALLGSLKDKVQASQVARAYQRDYKVSLKDQLKDSFDQEEITQVLKIISGLPKYRIL